MGDTSHTGSEQYGPSASKAAESYMRQSSSTSVRDSKAKLRGNFRLDDLRLDRMGLGARDIQSSYFGSPSASYNYAGGMGGNARLYSETPMCGERSHIKEIKSFIPYD